MVGYFIDSGTEVEVNHWTEMVGYLHDLAAGVEADHWMETVGYFHDQVAGVEADHWTEMFGYFHDQTALCVVYFSRKLDVAQSWYSHFGAQTSNKVIM